MNDTQLKIYKHLVMIAKEGITIPSLQDLADDLGMNYYTLSDNLIKLRKLGKIEYKSGHILGVYTENVKGVVAPSKTQQHKNKYSMNEIEDKFDECVKKIVLDYIKGIDKKEFTNNNINNTISSITSITNKLKEELFK